MVTTSYYRTILYFFLVTALLCFAALMTFGAQITGPSTAVPEQPVVLEVDCPSPVWTIFDSKGKPLPSDLYGSGRWIVTSSTEPTTLIAVAAYVKDGIHQVIHIVTVGDATPDPDPDPSTPLEKLLDTSLRPLLPASPKSTLLALARSYTATAILLRDGALSVEDLPDHQKERVLVALGDRREDFTPMLRKLGEILNATEAEAGWSTPVDYARIWDTVSSVLKGLAQ